MIESARRRLEQVEKFKLAVDSMLKAVSDVEDEVLGGSG